MELQKNLKDIILDKNTPLKNFRIIEIRNLESNNIDFKILSQNSQNYAKRPDLSDTNKVI